MSQPPPRRPRLDDVAADVGVSPATVSLVLRGIAGPSEATRERVLDAAARLGYRPDRAASVLASRRSRLIGVLLDIRNPFHAQLVEDIHEAAERYDYQLVLSTVTRSQNETRAVETLLDSRCAAVVLFGPEAPAKQLGTLSRQLPVVVVGRPMPTTDVDVVRTADENGLEQAVSHLVGLGHRDITHVDGGRGAVPTLRRRAYEQAMRRHELDDYIRVVAGGGTEAAGASAAKQLLAAPIRATAVAAFNDRCAVGLIDAVARCRIDVPGSVSVIGYDDNPVARLPHINLTTVGQNTRVLTEHAVAALIERLDNPAAEYRDITVPPHLVIRGTSGPPPG